MRRIAALACGLTCLVLPTSASAAVTPSRTAADVATSLLAPAATAAGTGSAFTVIPPNGDPIGIGNASLGGFPTTGGGTFAVLSSGDAPKADPATPSSGTDDGGTPTDSGRDNVWDLTTLRLDATVPDGVNCAVFTFRFYTDESPGNGTYNDGFIAELDTSNWAATSGEITAPNNFAFDVAGNVISVNSPGSTGLTQDQATGTGFVFATAKLTAATPITSGAHSIYLSIFDQGDAIVDSAVFVDDLDLQQRPASECVRGAQDENVPIVTLNQPASGSDTTPTLSGQAGNAPGDATTVDVEIRAGGSLVQTLTATRSPTVYSVDAAPLPDGTYTARAVQRDEAGNVGVSATRTFTISTPPPPPQQDVGVQQQQSPDPEPVQGQTFVAGAIGSGTVKIRLRGGKFRTLGANEAIPLGSEIDATKGRVRLTSAAGGGKTQTADFYKGVFIVTQTKGRKPVTQLKLTGALSCSKKGKASAAAKKKKVRRLWGDGKGRFRTRGRNAAATVRGTKWLTEDRCDRTRISVRRGSVSVRDFIKKKTKLIKAGRSYTARDRIRGRRPK